MKSWLLAVVVLAAGCAASAPEVVHSVILPEQRTIAYRDPEQLPPARLPDVPPPRTVTEPTRDTVEWQLSLDEAIRIALENARVVRTLAGVTAVSTGQTIYDPAISNTVIDQEQGRFDPNLFQNNRGSRTESPFAIPNPAMPGGVGIAGTRQDEYRADVGIEQVNVAGGRTALTWVENPIRFADREALLNPQVRGNVELSYTQPLLKDAGFLVNTAPVVIARLNTERSYFQFKDSVQELVRGTVEAYWELVQARTDVWARKIQVEQSEEAYRREQARKQVGLADFGEVAQSRVTFTQFRANLIAAEAAVLAREGALRNLLGLPPEDGRRIVPTSFPTDKRLSPNWAALLRLAEQRRPDVVELKLVLEADLVRLAQADNQTLPRLDAVALYRWNGLSGEVPTGEWLASASDAYTDWSLGINFSVPLGFRADRARLRQQNLIVARDRANVEQSLHAAAHQLAGTLRDLDNAFAQYLAFRETREAAYDNLKVQIEEFRARRNIYLNVLQALNDWGNAVTSEARALLTYNTLLATLERQTGTILETHGLVFYEERSRSAGPLGILGHGRDYPSAVVPAGEPGLYPSRGEPGENKFELNAPEIEPPAPTPPPRLPVPAENPP